MRRYEVCETRKRDGNLNGLITWKNRREVIEWEKQKRKKGEILEKTNYCLLDFCKRMIL